MTALAADKKTSDQIDTPDGVIPRLTSFGVAASTKIYAGSMVAINSSGYAVPASANNTLKIIGRCEAQADNSSGAAAAINVPVRRGCFFMDIAATTIADVGKLCYAVDDHTVSTSDGAGLFPAAGVIQEIRGTTEVGVLLGQPSLYDDLEVTAGAMYARAVATSALAAYAAAAGVITESANGALGSVFDGVTIAAGDVIFLPEGIAAAAADAGPYVVTSLGGASSKFVLTRPDWWSHGSFISQSSALAIGPEGTLFKGTNWRSFVTTAIKVVGTDAPLLWPRRVVQSVALVAGTTTVSNVPVRSTTLTSVIVTRTVANTSTATTGGYFATAAGANGLTAGALGTGAVVIQACVAAGTINNADISTVNIAIENW